MNMEITIVRTPISKAMLGEMAKQQFGDMVKVVVEIGRGIMAVGGELHSDEESALLDDDRLSEISGALTCIPVEPPPTGSNTTR